MTFGDIFEDGRLYAVRYDGEEDNALFHLFRQWNDLGWLFDFFDKNMDDLQKELSERLGCTQQYVSKILKGNENLSLEMLCNIESVLQFNFCQFLPLQAQNVNVYSKRAL